MGVLTSIRGPGDLKGLSASQLSQLASEIREFLVAAVSRTGGHLGPNLGVVELTIAIHRVFESPRDPIIFDVGHQSYVHKMLTGRQAGFGRLRQRGGLSGYPSRSESPHDMVENSHASAALSWADGLASAFRLRGEHDRTVVAVVGDGALTGGMAWEALNNIAARHEQRLVIVVNDNGRSYSPTIGGLANHLASLRLSHGYDQALGAMKTTLERTPVIGPSAYQHLAGLKRGLKDVISPQVLFEDLGLKYVGPIDGHDEQAVEHALGKARRFGRPVIVHCLTRKGHGYLPAENDEEDCLHGPGTFDPKTGRPTGQAQTTWTDIFGAEMLRVGAERPDVVAVTAAMLGPLGLAPFAAAFPERLFDVGIAEAHALTTAAGLALGGLHPVVALYSTFLNRAFDQVLMDIALHGAPVTIVLDRAGVTGPDGPSHHGMWDLSILHTVPGIKVAAPRDAARLRQLLGEAVAGAGPTALRFPKGPVPAEIPAVDQMGSADVLYASPAGTKSGPWPVGGGRQVRWWAGWPGSRATSVELTLGTSPAARRERHMKATIDGTVVADAPESDLISIEGNYYFPPSSISAGALSDSPTPYTCPWKGVAQYHDISAGGSAHHDAAWSYPDPYPASFDRVGKDYSSYVAFDKKQVTVAE